MSRKPPPIDPRKRGISAIEQQAWAMIAHANTRSFVHSNDTSVLDAYARMGRQTGPSDPAWYG